MNISWMRAALFAPSDTFELGTKNGNGGQYFVGGGNGSGPGFACDTAALTAAGMATAAVFLGQFRRRATMLVLTHQILMFGHHGQPEVLSKKE